jgi:isoquinoline 1-oxidoreductase alpha subunit
MGRRSLAQNALLLTVIVIPVLPILFRRQGRGMTCRWTNVELFKGTEMKVNGQVRHLAVDGDTPVLWALRDVLGMTGTKFGCGRGLCGACTVHIDGVATRSCITTVESVGGANIGTIEALSHSRVGAALQQAWLELDVVQCGYCQSGQLMSAASLLAANPTPADKDIDDAMAGNICRCGTYPRIRAGIKQAAQALAAVPGKSGAKGKDRHES